MAVNRVPKNKIPRPGGGRSSIVALAEGKVVTTDTVGTVDRAIRENNIFTAVSCMPDEIQTMLLENGWIGKFPSSGNNTNRKNVQCLLILL